MNLWGMKTRVPVVLLATLLLTASARAEQPAPAGHGVKPVGTVAYEGGTHLALATIKGRDYAFASSMGGGTEPGAVRVIDVTKPPKPKVVAEIPCRANQSHLQISHDQKTLVIGEDGPHQPDACSSAGMGFFTVDISDPTKPEILGVADVARGAHTTTTHPTKPIVYVSYGDVVTAEPPAFEVWSIANPAKPKLLSVVPVTGYHGPHDITFTSNGHRAVAASMSLLQVLDTSDPTKPRELAQLQCPGCTHNHEVRFTPDERYAVVSDETPSGPSCPLGGLYVYEWKAKAAPHLDLVGQWQPQEAVTPSSEPTRPTNCTSHTFGISPDGKSIAASWHTAGLRVVDISDPEGIGVGDQGTGPRETAWFQPGGGDAFSAKFDRSGRYVFVNDHLRGFEVFRVEAAKSKS